MVQDYGELECSCFDAKLAAKAPIECFRYSYKSYLLLYCQTEWWSCVLARILDAFSVGIVLLQVSLTGLPPEDSLK